MAEKLAPVQVAAAFQSVGKTLGSYRVLDGIALGSLSERYLARVVSGNNVGEYVLLEQLKPSLATDVPFARLFVDEARRAASLTHNNVRRVLEFGHRDGVYFFATEYLHGHSVRALMDKLRALSETDEHKMPLQHALTVVAAAAAGLQYTHEMRDPTNISVQFTHSAVSPANIVITYDGAVKVVEFALARVASSDLARRKQLSRGKAAYFSPEQCQNKPLARLDRRSDIFSLGVILYELTTGRRLFRTGDRDSDFVVMNRITRGEVPPPTSFIPDYPRSLEDVVMQALAIQPKDRHPNAQALMLDVQAVARTQGLTLAPDGLASFLRATLGAKIEPWKELEEEEEEDDDELELDDDISPDEFGEEVATTLYTGNAEDIKDAWAAEALAPGVRASSHSGITAKNSERRLALPLQAKEEDEPASTSGELPVRGLSSRPITNTGVPPSADHPLPSEPTLLDGLKRAPSSSPLPQPLPLAQPGPLAQGPAQNTASGKRRPMSQSSAYDVETAAISLKSSQQFAKRRAKSGPYLDIQPGSPTRPLPPSQIDWWKVTAVAFGVALAGIVAFLLLTQ